MDQVNVERLGGLAGFGGARSRLKSGGHVQLDTLSAADRDRLKRLFDCGQKPHTPVTDGFTYRITLTGSAGVKVVELAEAQVPAVLVACVVDRLE